MALVNDGGPLVTCDICGCSVTHSVARERSWGVLIGQPCCSRSCAEVLYAPWYVRAYFKAPSPDLPRIVAPWLYA